jgi:hypothetical protein
MVTRSPQLNLSVPRPHFKEAFSANIVGLFSIAQPDVYVWLQAFGCPANQAILLYYVYVTVPII